VPLNTGSDELQIMAVCNNGSYESISITAWMAGNPDLLLSTNFGVPESVFAKFPKDTVIMPDRQASGRGACRAALSGAR